MARNGDSFGGYKFFVRLGEDESSPTCSIRRSNDELSNDEDSLVSFCHEVLDKYLDVHHYDDNQEFDITLKYYFCCDHTAPNWWNSIDNQQDFEDALQYGIQRNRLLQLIAIITPEKKDIRARKALASPPLSSVQQQQRRSSSTSRNEQPVAVVASSSNNTSGRMMPPPPRSLPQAKSPPIASTAVAGTTSMPPPQPPTTRVVPKHRSSPSQLKDVTTVGDARNQKAQSQRNVSETEPKKADTASSPTSAPKKNPLPLVPAAASATRPATTSTAGLERPNNKNAASLVAVVTAAKDRSPFIGKNPPPDAQAGSNKREANTAGIEESASNEMPAAKMAKVSGSTGALEAGSIDGNNMNPQVAAESEKKKSESELLEDQIMRAMTEMNVLGITKPPFETVASFIRGSSDCKNRRQMISAAFSELSKKKLYIQVSKSDDRLKRVGFQTDECKDHDVVRLTRVGIERRNEYNVNTPQTRDEVHQRIKKILQSFEESTKNGEASASVPLFHMLRSGESYCRDDIATELGEDGIPRASLPDALFLLTALGIVDYVDTESVRMVHEFAFPFDKESTDCDVDSGSISSPASAASDNSDEGEGIDGGSDSSRFKDEMQDTSNAIDNRVEV